MIIVDKAYINRKIKKCAELAATAISDAQKEIYLGYLDHWKTFVKNIKFAKAEDVKITIVDISIIPVQLLTGDWEIQNAPYLACYRRN